LAILMEMALFLSLILSFEDTFREILRRLLVVVIFCYIVISFNTHLFQNSEGKTAQINSLDQQVQSLQRAALQKDQIINKFITRAYLSKANIVTQEKEDLLKKIESLSKSRQRISKLSSKSIQKDTYLRALWRLIFQILNVLLISKIKDLFNFRARAA
jgi:hypothetical protein